MKRIECEGEGCDQLLTVRERRCDSCGHQQTTRSWLVVLLVLYYPVMSLLAGIGILIVGGLLFPVRFVQLGPIAIVGVMAAVYLILASSSIRAYVRRNRRIRDSTDTVEYSTEG